MISLGEESIDELRGYVTYTYHEYGSEWGVSKKDITGLGAYRLRL